jgi:hypothetical protein
MKITIQTMEGDQTIDLSEPRGVVIFHIEGQGDMTIRPSEYGIEVRHGRLNRRLVLRPESSSSVHVSVENDF